MSTPDPITVYILESDAAEASDVPDALIGRLDEADRERLSSMTSRKRRREFVLGRLLLGHALRHRHGNAASAWRLSAPAGEALALSCAERGMPVPAVSLSHSAGLVACALAPVARLGVDVERCRARRTSLQALAELALHPREQAELAALDEPAGLRRFYELWTLKEALAKALGRGIDLGLGEFAFHCGRLVAQPEHWAGAGIPWRFATRAVGTDGVLGLAWSGAGPAGADGVVLRTVAMSDLGWLRGQ